MKRFAAFLSGALVCSVAFVALGLAAPKSPASSTATPAELVSTYETLADAILAVKSTEANLVRSVLGTGYAHARSSMHHAQQALEAGDTNAARAHIESLAAHVAQLGAEGDNSIARVRKRLLEGGHHHNAAGEQKGIYDPGFVIVTRAAKRAFLDASKVIGKLARSPNADALAREWKKVETVWAGMGKKKK